jgi:hypothetical protein
MFLVKTFYSADSSCVFLCRKSIVEDLCWCYINQRHYLLACQKVKKKQEVSDKYVRELRHRVSVHMGEVSNTTLEAIRSQRKRI